MVEIIEKEVKIIKYEWRKWNHLMFFLILILTLESVLTGALERFLLSLGQYGYLGALFAGFFFTFGVTTPFSIAAFFILAEILNIWLLTFIGSLSGLISEYMIYNFVKSEAGKTIKIYKNRGIRLPRIKSKFFHKVSPLIAGFIIATPIPDELVAVLFGAEKYEIKKFLILTFIFKFIGIFIIVGLGRIF